jgi:hypothetical protein
MSIGCFGQQRMAQALSTPLKSASDGQTKNSSNNADRFLLHIELVHPVPSDQAVIALKITVTNLTNDLLLLPTFRGEWDSRVILERQSTQLRQRDQLEDGSFPRGRVTAAIDMAIKPHSSSSELAALSSLYRLSSGNYRTYIITYDSLTKRSVRSNTLSFDYLETQAANAR